MKVHFEKAFARLTELVNKNAERASLAIRKAVHAAVTGDVAEAEWVIKGDDTIDLGENEIEERCLEILALYQPVAGDLRRVMTLFKANGEIERAGDLAVNIANRVVDRSHLYKHPPWDFADLAEQAVGMFVSAIEALKDRDVSLCQAVIEADDDVDACHRKGYTRVAEGMVKEPKRVHDFLNALTISRALERIADIATNIAEDVIYQETAENVRHAAARA